MDQILLILFRWYAKGIYTIHIYIQVQFQRNLHFQRNFIIWYNEGEKKIVQWWTVNSYFWWRILIRLEEIHKSYIFGIMILFLDNQPIDFPHHCQLSKSNWYYKVVCLVLLCWYRLPRCIYHDYSIFFTLQIMKSVVSTAYHINFNAFQSIVLSKIQIQNTRRAPI